MRGKCSIFIIIIIIIIIVFLILIYKYNRVSFYDGVTFSNIRLYSESS